MSEPVHISQAIAEFVAQLEQRSTTEEEPTSE